MDSRDVQPEILDGLAPEDPRAVASRRDLKLIDALMGNYAWLADRLADESPCTPVAELGAGDGRLSNYRNRIGKLEVTGFDQAPMPQKWAAAWNWERGDLLTPEQIKKIAACEVVAASLFIHHLGINELETVGTALSAPESRVRRMLFAEPARYKLHSLQGYFLYPLGINEVTRHDLQASIRAGFRPGEITRALKLDPDIWSTRESRTFFGALRIEISRTA